MNRGELRVLLRERVKDRNEVEWDDAYLNGELNLAAQDVALFLAQHSTIDYCRAKADITLDGRKTYPLAGVLDIFSPLGLEPQSLKTSNIRDGRQIPENDAARLQEKYRSGIDEDGKLLFYLTYHPDYEAILHITGTGGTYTLDYSGDETGALAFNATAAQVQTALEGLTAIGSGNVEVTEETTGQLRIRFVGSLRGVVGEEVTVDAASLTGGTATVRRVIFDFHILANSINGPLRLVYCRQVPEIPVGAGDENDERRFAVVPEPHQELIVIRAAAVILGYDGSSTIGFATSMWQLMSERFGRDVTAKAQPFRFKG